MTVAQAIYGAVGKGHALIGASPGAAAVAQRIVGRTDLPNTAPPGINWARFDSLFVHDGHLCLLRTWPDAQAERAGMVLTHGLFVPWPVAATTNDLASIAALLPNMPKRDVALTDLPAPPAAVAPEVPDHAYTLMDALLGNDDAAPIVWLGEDGLLAAAAGVWRFLPANVRKTVSLRISFGPDDIGQTPPRFVSTPRVLAPRWQGRVIVDPQAPAGTASEMTRSLMLDAPAQSIQAYADRFGVEIGSVRELALLQQSWSLAQTTPSFSSALGELRLLLRLSPGSATAKTAKHAVVRELADHVTAASAEEILRLRNIDIGDWAADELLWPKVAAWSEKAATNPSTDDSALWQAAAGGTARAVWNDAIWSGFTRALKSPSAATCGAWWRRWLDAPPLVGPAFERIPKGSKTETELMLAFPAEIPIETATAVMDAARSKKWLLLHATAARALPVADAMQAQLAIDTDTAHPAGIRVLLDGAADDQVIALALRFEDTRLVTAAAKICAARPTALVAFELSNATWREILIQAARENDNFHEGLADHAQLKTQMLAALKGGEALQPEFLVALANSPLGDLSSIPNLETVWPQIPDAARPAFLARTAEAWLTAFVAGDVEVDQLGQTLRRAVVADGVWYAFLQGRDRSPTNAMRCFEAFSELSANALLAWLNEIYRNRTNLDRPIAERLGRLVRQRHWYGAAGTIARYLYSDRWLSLAPAIPAIKPMLGIVDSSMLFFSGIYSVPPTADEVWSAFEHVAADLYPDGPNDEELWSRAGGKKSQLPGGKSGGSKWHATVSLLKRGGASITGRAVLREMLQDHPRNENLQWLAQQHWLGN